MEETMRQREETSEALGLLILRIGLAWFLLVWAVDKILAPEQYINIWGYFHGIEIGAVLVFFMGGAQIAISLMMVLGVWRNVIYGLGFAMHAVTVAVIFPLLADPFVIENGYPVNRNQSIAVAALAGFAALWLLRHRDHWSLDVWLKRKSRED